jgi:hypothetical protein
MSPVKEEREKSGKVRGLHHFPARQSRRLARLSLHLSCHLSCLVK